MATLPLFAPGPQKKGAQFRTTAGLLVEVLKDVANAKVEPKQASAYYKVLPQLAVPDAAQEQNDLLVQQNALLSEQNHLLRTAYPLTIAEDVPVYIDTTSGFPVLRMKKGGANG